MPGQAAGLEQVARGVEVHLGAELEVLLRAARNQRCQMEYRPDLRRYQGAGELRIGEVAEHACRLRLVGRQYVAAGQGTDECGTDIARRAGDEYSHGDNHSKRRKYGPRRFRARTAFVQRLVVVAVVSHAAREDRGSLRGRRLGRRVRALPRRQAAGKHGPDVRDREPPRRRLDRRHRRGRQVRARRLHAAHDVEHAHGERDPHPEKALRPDARFRADQRGELFRPDDGRAAHGAGRQPQGIHRARQIEARRAELRVLGQRYALPHGRRAVQIDGRRGHRARAAQGQRPGARRGPRRPGADDVRRGADHGGAGARRQGESARHLRRQALAGHARRADAFGGRGAGLRVGHLARPDGAGEDAAPGAGEAQRRSEQAAQFRRGEGQLGQAGHHHHGHVDRAVRQVPARGNREVGQGGEDIRGEGRLTDERLSIIAVVHDWALWRDAGDWERFATVWHDDGWMTATWFQGPAAEFIKVSKAGFDKGVSILHFLGGSSVDLAGSRAVAQTKMTISQRGRCEGELVDVVCTGRFYDFFEKRRNRWAIVRRQPIYEKDRMDPVDPSVRIKLDADLLASLPEGYRHLGYLQTKLGFRIKRDLPQLKGAAVEALYRHGRAWLDGAASSFPGGSPNGD